MKLPALRLGSLLIALLGLLWLGAAPGLAQGPEPVERTWSYPHGRGTMRFVYDARGLLLERRTTMCLERCGDEVLALTVPLSEVALRTTILGEPS